MPFKSKAQARAMHAKAERGEIKESVVKEFDKATDFSKLPSHVPHKGSSNHLASPKAHRNVVSGMRSEGISMQEHRRTSRGAHRTRGA